MLQTFNLPYVREIFAQWFEADAQKLYDFTAAAGVDGIEIIHGLHGEVQGFPHDLIRGYHLIFYADWLDFWRNDEPRLLHKFGDMQTCRNFMELQDAAAMEEALAADFARAETFGVPYAVFHVSDVSIEELYTRRWLHTDEEIIDATATLLNRLLVGQDYQFELLLENLPWPGLQMTEPALAHRLISQIEYPHIGFMLDLGHLMCTNPNLATEEEAADYILRCVDNLGNLAGKIRGLHLHKSLSGDYIRACIKNPPPIPDGNPWQQFAESYAHILRIDRHEPCETTAMRRVIKRLQPAYITHELAAPNAAAKLAAIKQQRMALGL